MNSASILNRHGGRTNATMTTHIASSSPYVTNHNLKERGRNG
jgi:hypothetical protein